MHARSICLALLGAAAAASQAAAQTQIRPRVMVMIDTSSSMTSHFQDNVATGGDGSLLYRDAVMTRGIANGDGNLSLYVGAELGTLVCPAPANQQYDGQNSRMFAAKAALTNAMNGSGNIDWGLMRYSGTQCATIAHTFAKDTSGIVSLGAIPEPPGRCTNNADCKNGQACDLVNNTCRCVTAATDCNFNGGTWTCTAGHCAAGSNSACPAPFSRNINLCRCTASSNCGNGVCANSICDCAGGGTDACTAAAPLSRCTPGGSRTCECAGGAAVNPDGSCPCGVDSQCPNSDTCSGVCGSFADFLPQQCGGNSGNCGTGQSCVNNKCTCATDDDCRYTVLAGLNTMVQYCINGTCGWDQNFCSVDSAWGATDHRNNQTCGTHIRDNDGASGRQGLTYGGSCGNGPVTGSSCPTKLVCYKSGDCLSNNCVMNAQGTFGECSCNTAADCPVGPNGGAMYNCSGNRCVYNAPCIDSGGLVLVDPAVAGYSSSQVFPYVNNVEDLVAGDPELRASGSTPLAGAARQATAWYTNIKNATNGAANFDPKLACRPYVLVQMTDGFDTCEDNNNNSDPRAVGPTAAASGFVDATVANAKVANKVYVIGLAFGGNPTTTLDNIAAAGGTGKARLANSAADIEAALADIVSSSVLVELCNNQDDDCDGTCDEPYPDVAVTNPACSNQRTAKSCDNGATGHCDAPGVFVCSTDKLSEVCQVRGCTNGSAASASGKAGNVITITGVSGFSAQDVGRTFTILNATNTGNVGNFVIKSVNSASSITVTNPNGVNEAGTIQWNIYCSNAESCNGFDDNCNGVIDDCAVDGQGNPIAGSCCTSSCPACARPDHIEVCNGCDDDCDGVIDDNLVDTGFSCGNNVGDCSYGTAVCCKQDPNGTGSPPCVGNDPTDRLFCKDGNPGYPATADRCDGTDDNCDGVANGGPAQGCYTDPNGATIPPSLVGHGICRAGSQTCNTVALPAGSAGCPAGWPAGKSCPNPTSTFTACANGVAPHYEICNGLDDDCNDQVDENLDPTKPENAGIGNPCCPTGNNNDCTNSGAGTRCKLGTIQCCSPSDAGCSPGGPFCKNGVAKSIEVCNGLDDDCNGIVDDVAGIGEPCTASGGGTVGPCGARFACHPQSPGSGPNGLTCDPQATPMPEVCDGIDNDCDGIIDNADKVAANDPRIAKACDAPVAPADQPPCAAGKSACVGGKVVCEGAVHPLPNRCGTTMPTDCTGMANDGVCPAGTMCVGGTCATPCADSEPRCAGGQRCDTTLSPPSCVADLCLGFACPSGQRCQLGDGGAPACVAPTSSPAAGCGCDVTRRAPDEGAAWLMLVVLAVLARRRRFALVGGVLVMALITIGCGAGPSCKPSPEVCDGVDNDCNGIVDDVAPGALAGDPNHCGTCTTVCTFNGTHQLGACVASACQPSGCVPGWIDLDGNPANGCESACTPSVPATDVCNGVDDDCNGKIDDPFTLTWDATGKPNYDKDPANCGGCGIGCALPGAVSKCAAGPTGLGTCQLDHCINKPGVDTFKHDPSSPLDVNVVGCEYHCPVASSTAGDCNAPTNTCTFPSELCNGKDDDCNFKIDDNPTDPTLGNPCGTACPGGDVANCKGECKAGVLQCTTGVLVCVGSSGPMAETCNGKDDDCNGKIDDPFTRTYTGTAPNYDLDPAHCGSCAGACPANATTHATWGCHIANVNAAANCFVVSCNSGFNYAGHTDTSGQPGSCNVPAAGPRDSMPGNPSSGLGCYYQCPTNGVGVVPPPGPEVCDGYDNDCNGCVDDALTAPNNFCSKQGLCAGTGPGQSPATLFCNGASGWQCDYYTTLAAKGAKVDLTAPNRTGALSPTEAECDGLDNNCNGACDEDFLSVAVTNPSCSNNGRTAKTCSTGQGTCTLSGAFACSANTLSQVCADAGGVPLPPSGDTTKATDELCNGKDDDCNGLVDESTSFTIGGKTLQGWHDPVVQFSVPADPGFQGLPAHTIFMYQYEASRPDATALSQGGLSTRACSNTGTIPWSSVTWNQAQAACTAAGGRLCTAVEWQTGCEGPTPPSAPTTAWSLSTNPTVYPNASATPPGGACNDVNQTATPSVWVTAKAGRASPPLCYTDWANGDLLDDLSGNLSEWTQTPTFTFKLSGFNATIAAMGTAGTMRLQGVSGPIAVGDLASTAGSATASHNGVFVVKTVQSATTIDVTNPGFPASGVADEVGIFWKAVVQDTYYGVRGGSFTSPSGGTTCEFNFDIAKPTFANSDVGFRCCFTSKP